MFEIVSFLLILSMFIAMYRFLNGPTLSDRLVAFDIISIIGVSLLVVLALYFKRDLYLDIALVYGLISFLGTTIFGLYIEKGI